MYVGRLGIKGVVGIFGGGDQSFSRAPLKASKDRIYQQAYDLGKALAELQAVHLLTGGGGGVMKAVSEGFYSVHPRAGLILGIIPAGKKVAEYPNEWVEIPVFTHLTGEDPKGELSRNHINVLSSDLIIALPGDKGSLAEVELTADTYGKPLRVYLTESTDTIGGKNAAALGGHYPVATSQEEVMDFILSELAKK